MVNLNDKLPQQSLRKLAETEPAVCDFLESIGLTLPESEVTVTAFFETSTVADSSDKSLLDRFLQFMDQVTALGDEASALQSLTIEKGRTKSGTPESLGLHIQRGEILSIVGPTGAGKSRLLEDIECLACGDTPSRRQVLINGAAPESQFGWAGGRKLVAQVSQNMNFIIDLTVAGFLRLHAESRLVADPDAAVQEVFQAAIDLAGEPFLPEASLTALSGGQSRALMVADTACLSPSPVVLIDELENAGIDKERALSLLVSKDKIILIATHDPLLALLAHRRVVIQNGGMVKVIEKTPEEMAMLTELKRRDDDLCRIRSALRKGEVLGRPPAFPANTQDQTPGVWPSAEPPEA